MSDRCAVEMELKKLPRHIAIIMDGNGRWAKLRNRPRIFGHQEGLKVVRKIVQACGELNIEVLTLFAFSSENWRRPIQEVNGLMSLFLITLQTELNRLCEANVQLRIIGSCEVFNKDLLQWITKAQAMTENNTGLKLVIAVNYSGQWDIIQAVKQIVVSVKNNKIQSEDIDKDQFAQYLALADLPAPDLLIRTGGEYRVSNFLLWHLAYTELYFTDILWPGFTIDELKKALTFYTQRERRFGFTSEQITECMHMI